MSAIMRLLLMLFLAASASAQSPVILAGVELRLGMTKDATLAQFAGKADVRVDQLGTDSYLVAVRPLGSGWQSGGGVLFQSGKLSRINVTNCVSNNEKPAATLAKALYTAVAGGEKAGLLGMWTERNDDANNPLHKVVLAFKDREVSVISVNHNNVEMVSVETYFPRLRTADKSPSKR
jgi:hypothetical protein